MYSTENLKIVIPARLGSNRIKVKNLRILGDKPLIKHIISSLKKTKYLKNNIVINSDSDLFEKISNEEKIGFYKRDAELATSASLIDDYIYDYMVASNCEYLAVVNPTSPFMSSESLDKAWLMFCESNCDTLLSCEKIQTHCFINGESINFSTNGQHPRSQDLEPIRALNFAITIWKTQTFKDSYQEKGHGVYSGNIAFFDTDGYENIDIDYPDDFQMAELAYKLIEQNSFEDEKYPSFVEQYLANNPKVEN